MAKAMPVSQHDVTTQLQIFLDQQLFGPGKIDGRPGEFVTKALNRYQRAHGLPETGKLDENIPLDSVFPVYTTYTIEERDLKFVGEVPRSQRNRQRRNTCPTSRSPGIPHRALPLRARSFSSSINPGDETRLP